MPQELGSQPDRLASPALREIAAIAEPRYPRQAVRAYLSGTSLDTPGAGAWILFGCLTGLFLTGLVCSTVCRVEQVSTFTGRLHASESEPFPEVVVAIPAADRPFIAIGRGVIVESTALPDLRLPVRFVSIAADLATSRELSDAVGDDVATGPAYLARLALEPKERESHFADSLPTGLPVFTRSVVRSRRLIALILDPLARWSP